MNVAFVVLYLIPASGTFIEVPQRFATVDECQESADRTTGIVANTNENWLDDENLGGLVSLCVPIMQR